MVASGKISATQLLFCGSCLPRLNCKRTLISPVCASTFAWNITTKVSLQCLLLLVKSAKSMCWRRMLILLDNRSLVAEAKERSRVKHRKFHTLPYRCQTQTIADAIRSGRSFPSLQPFDFVADLTALDPQDIFGGIRGLSEVRYEKDLYRVFNESAPTQNKELAAMHKTWFEVSCSTDRSSCYANSSQRSLGLNCTTSETPNTCLLPASPLGISCSQAAYIYIG